MEIHELNTFSGTLGANDFFVTDNGDDTSKVSAENMLAPLNARIDNIITSPAPTEEEIIDARLGADGVIYSSLGEAIRTQISDVDNVVEGVRTRNYQIGKKVDKTDGSIVSAANICVSERVEITWTGYARYYCGDSTVTSSTSPYQVGFYDASDNFIQALVIGAEYRAINAETQVTLGTPKYVRFAFKKGYNGKITESASTPVVNHWIATDTVVEDGLVQKIGDLNDLNTEEKNSLVGAINEISNSASTSRGSLSISAPTLASGASLYLSDAPRFIKKNVGVTACMSFASFTRITIGKGYNQYRGRWLVIDSANITPYYYDGTAAVAGTSIPHGLTISEYIQVSMFMAGDGKCRISINTLTGTFSTLVDFLYEWNYAPFVFGAQNMTDVRLNYACADLKSDLWLFGDSYMGIATNRIGGQLKNLGFFNYCINAIAGGRAVDTGTPNKSASEDLTKMLALATPKHIIWSLGMNGGDANNIAYLPTLISLCQSKGIELILYMPPSVPSIDHTQLNNYIASTGLRYINGNEAVGATSSGVWYTGYLSDDEIHPSALGAMALAMRFIADAPELVQFGYSTGNVDGEINGDEH